MTAKKTTKPEVEKDTETTPPEPTEFEDASGVLGSDQVQASVDEAEEKGFLGVATDPRPNSDYSMEGGAPGTESAK